MSDIRFNQWLHQSGTGGVSQVDGGHVGIGTTNPDIAVHTANTKKINVGIVTANSVYAGAYYGDGSNLTGLASDKIEEGDTKVEVVDSGSQYIVGEVNGTERLRITSDGRIGINDSSPNDYELDIQKRSTATDANLRLYNNATGSNNDTILRLHIAGTSASNYIYFGDGDDSNVGQIRYQHSNDSMQFFTGSGERLRIDSSGKIGINRTATDHPLEIQHASEPTVSLWRGSTKGAALQAQSGGTYLYSYQNAPLIFSVNSANGFSERVRIKSDGNVNVGENSSVSGLRYFDVQNDSAGANNHGSIIRLITSNAAGNATTSVDIVKYKDGNFFINNNETSGGIFFNTGGSTSVLINSDGDLKVGTTGNSGAKIQIGNHTFAGTNFAYNNDRVGFQNNGSLTCISNCSTYNDGTHPGYGVVLVQGANTSSYNVWGICPDGPAKGNSLNLHYGAQATNIHSPTNFKFRFTGNGQFLKPSNPAFRARASSGGWKSFGNTNFNIMPFNAEDFDNGNHYNTSTYKFTVPVSGKYYFYCQMNHDGTSTNNGNSGRMQIVVAGVAVIAFGKSGSQGETVSCGTVWSCTAGNEVYCEGRTNITNADDWHGDSYYSYFTGYLIG